MCRLYEGPAEALVGVAWGDWWLGRRPCVDFIVPGGWRRVVERVLPSVTLEESKGTLGAPGSVEVRQRGRPGVQT